MQLKIYEECTFSRCAVHFCRRAFILTTWWRCTPSAWPTRWTAWRPHVGPAPWCPRTPNRPVPPAFPALLAFSLTEKPTDARSVLRTRTCQVATSTARRRVSPVGLEALATRCWVGASDCSSSLAQRLIIIEQFGNQPLHFLHHV